MSLIFIRDSTWDKANIFLYIFLVDTDFSDNKLGYHYLYISLTWSIKSPPSVPAMEYSNQSNGFITNFILQAQYEA